MRVAVLGRTAMLYNTIQLLQESDNDIVLIGTCIASEEYSIKETEYQKIAEKLEIPFFCSSKINSDEIISLLKEVKADIAISVNWVNVIGKSVIECFRHGVINAHCGDLPRYRGNACLNWAIIKGEEKYAICIHYMEPDSLDSGDIILKRFFPITDDINITDIYENIEKQVPTMFMDAIELINANECMAIKQSSNIADSLRCYPRIPTDSFIDWNYSCEEIMRIIRASSNPFSGAFTFYGKQKLYIMNASTREFDAPCYVYPGQVINVSDDKVDIAASDGIISISDVICKNKIYSANTILKSIRIRLNYCLEEEIYQIRKELDGIKMKLGMEVSK